MEEKTNVQVMDFSRQVLKDEKGFFVYLDVYAKPITFTGIKAYISDEDTAKLRSPTGRRSAARYLGFPPDHQEEEPE